MRGYFILSMLLGATPVWAQSATVAFTNQRSQTTMQLQIVQDGQPPVTFAKPDEIVARVMSFDRDGDGKVARAELAERMESLVEEADSSGDGTLDESEVRAVAERPVVEQTFTRGFQAGHYAFIDESGQSSRLRVQGVLADLKLPDATFREAAAIVTRFLNDLGDVAIADLLDDMRNILTAEELSRLATVLKPDSQIRNLSATGRNGPVAVLLVNGGQRVITVSLPEAQKDQGRAVADRFNKRPRLAEDADRNALLDRMQNLLTDEQRDDFRAALARRPIAKTGSAPNLAMSDAMERIRALATQEATERMLTFLTQSTTPVAVR